MSGCLLLLSHFLEIHVCSAKSVDPDQMPHSVASDLGLHCLQMSILWDARHKWVKKAVFVSETFLSQKIISICVYIK